MRFLIALFIAVASLLLTLYCYVSRLYSEKGRFFIRGSKDNVDFFEEHIEAKLKIGEEEAERTFPLLIRLTVVFIVVLAMAWDRGKPIQMETVVQVAALIVVILLFFAEVIPQVLLTRTAGTWLSGLSGILRASILCVFPLVAIGHFLNKFAALGSAAESESEEPSPSEGIEALTNAGEEEGLIEEEDSRLIRSVVEFGDKTVGDVMTPRPKIFAVPVETTLTELKRMLATRRYSRIPAYRGDLDHIQGFVHAKDILPLSDKDVASSTIKEMLRPITFVPETKKVSELLKELQRKTKIAIVVDEYGSVAGLVTVEDMVEEIVGDIRDEHETQEVLPHGDRGFSVPGGTDLARLDELFGVRIDEPGDATTIAGLITHTMGRVPLPGESIERNGLVFQVTESNGRRIDRLLIRTADNGRASDVASPAPEQTFPNTNQRAS